MHIIPETSQYDLPAGALISAIATHDASDTRSSLMVRLRNLIEKGRAEQKEWALRFESLYEEARTSDWSEPILTQWAAALLEKQRAALERFHPMLEGLQRRAADYVARPDPKLLGLYQESIELILGWIAPYQVLCGKLLELAAERRDSGDKILRARPAEGEIDHAELTREIIARFPQILAELAK